MAISTYLTQQILDAIGDLDRNIPTTATPFSATNATAVAASATAKEVRAAVTGKRKWITQAIGINPTATEDAILEIRSGTTVLACIPAFNFGEGSAVVAGGGLTVSFNPPLVVASGEAINVGVKGDVGDSWLTCVGYEEA